MFLFDTDLRPLQPTNENLVDSLIHMCERFVNILTHCYEFLKMPFGTLPKWITLEKYTQTGDGKFDLIEGGITDAISELFYIIQATNWDIGYIVCKPYGIENPSYIDVFLCMIPIVVLLPLAISMVKRAVK